MADELMAAQAVQMDTAKQDWSAMASAAGEGRLRMEPGTAEACAQACAEASADLAAQTRAIAFHGRVEGLGVWNSGQQLAQKFGDKATGADNSAVSVLRAHQEVLRTMAETFRAAGAAYTASEEANAAAFRSES